MCFDDDSHPPIAVTDGTGAAGEDISLTAADGTRFAAYLATPGSEAEAQVLILPDIRGLHNFYRELAQRFAEIGVRALAIDYFGRTAPDNNRQESFEFMPHVERMSTETFGQDLEAGAQYLHEHDSSVPTFVVGFCMGGSLAFWAATRGLGFTGTIGFYAGLNRSRGAVTPVLDWANQIECPVLGLFGGADESIPQDLIDQFDRELQSASIEHEIVVYPGAPHSFFDRKANEFAQASADAWTRVQGFIAGHQPAQV